MMPAVLHSGKAPVLYICVGSVACCSAIFVLSVAGGNAHLPTIVSAHLPDPVHLQIRHVAMHFDL